MGSEMCIRDSVYLRVVSRGTCYCPSRLDFHPYTQLVRAICRSATVRSSTQLSPGFNLARNRSTGFRSPTIDFGRAHPVPDRISGCGLVGFPTASQINCLTSPMIRTPRGIFRNARIHAAHIFAFTHIQPVPDWFQVLFTSRQGYFSAFDHSTCQLSV